MSEVNGRGKLKDKLCYRLILAGIYCMVVSIHLYALFILCRARAQISSTLLGLNARDNFPCLKCELHQTWVEDQGHELFSLLVNLFV